MPFLPPNQQRQSTDGTNATHHKCWNMRPKPTNVHLCHRASGGSDYWIGLYKSAPAAADNCYWLDGNPSAYRKWHGSDPDSVDLCIRMFSNSAYRDISCDAAYGYVCKMDRGSCSVPLRSVPFF